MWGTFLFYKLITLLLFYIFPNLQEKPFYQFIYFAIVFVITLFIFKMSTKIFNKKIVINPVKSFKISNLLLLIVPCLLFGTDFIATIPNSKYQSFIIACSTTSFLYFFHGDDFCGSLHAKWNNFLWNFISFCKQHGCLDSNIRPCYYVPLGKSHYIV